MEGSVPRMEATNEDWLEKLNQQQRAAATVEREVPLLIVAGAGTGKTNTLAHRVAHLIASGMDPARILLLTFTRRAAAEMLRRVDRLISASAPSSRAWGGTFHSIGNRLLRIYAQSVGLADSFTVIDRSDAEDLLNDVRSELDFDKAEVRFPKKGTCLAIYSRCVNASEPIEQALASHFPWCMSYPEQLKSLFRAYVARKQAQSVLDYDDLLLWWFHLMQDEALAALMRQRFDAVLVDEYQDTNALQAAILKGLCPDGRGLTVVGDDAQSIYSFRAATVHNILDFPRTFPSAVVVKLEQNYRSVQPILDATNAVIALSPKRYNKELFSARAGQQKPKLVTLADEDQQSQYLISRILEHHEAGIPLRRQAVLFRAAHHSDALEIALGQKNIPFVKYGGLKFLEAAHVKDVIAILRVSENPRDSISAFRVLQLIDGIGPAHARRAIGHLSSRHHDLKSLTNFQPPAGAAGTWTDFVELLVRLAPDNLPLPEQIAHVRRFYTPILEKRYDQSHVRARDIEQLEQIAASFPDRRTMLTEMVLDPPSATQDLAGPPLLEEDYLILSTIHSAKGCEWDVVYVIHASDGNIPSDMATADAAQVEEERRLFYVALTRAKDFLEVCFPLKYYTKRRGLTDRHTYAQLTRFLPAAIVDKFERVAIATESKQDEAVTRSASGDIHKKIATMWT
jgi:DNA helicase-2/ATP-dependent DNA helicase PcrA